MGKRYSEQEMGNIRELVSEGYTDRDIGDTLGRTENGIRNLRYRLNLKKEREESLQNLERRIEENNKNIAELEKRKRKTLVDISILDKKRTRIGENLQEEKAELEARIVKTLIELKDRKPELFYITGEEQLIKLGGAIVESLIRWLVS